MAKRTSQYGIFTYLLLYLLAVLCIGYSTLQTAVGYELATGGKEKAWTISIIISICLMILNAQLWQNLSGRAFVKSWIVGVLYLAVASFSFSANFNAFFSEYMKKELLYDDLEKLQADLTAIKTQAVFALEKSHNANKIREDVQLLKTTLIEQILDPATPGYGTKAKKIVKDIEKILGVELTIPAGSPLQLAKAFGQQIDKLLEAKVAPIANEANKLKHGIEIAANNLQNKIDSAKATPDNIEDDKLVIEQGIKVYNSIGEEASKMINDITIFKFNRQSSENVEIGKISHSFKVALRGDYRTGALVSAGLSVLIDLLVPIMIIILTLFSPGKTKDQSIRFPSRNEENIATSASLPKRKETNDESYKRNPLDTILKAREEKQKRNLE